jgi:hypothetical protein
VSNSWTNGYDTFKGDLPYQTTSSNPNIAWNASNYALKFSQKTRMRAWTDESATEDVQRGQYDTIEQPAAYDFLVQPAAYDAIVDSASEEKGREETTLGNYDVLKAEASTDYDVADVHLPIYDRASDQVPIYDRAIEQFSFYDCATASQSDTSSRHDTVQLSPFLRLQDVYY